MTKLNKPNHGRADTNTMYGNGLYYDYANMTLNQVVEAFMADQIISLAKMPFHIKYQDK